MSCRRHPEGGSHSWPRASSGAAKGFVARFHGPGTAMSHTGQEV